MRLTYYLPRSLQAEDKIYSEAEIVSSSNFIVVLAEPGAGKTALLNSLAGLLSTHTTTANAFSHIGANEKNSPLVIDAFDELAKVEQSGIYKVLAKARESDPTHVIISSRSSEWSSASTKAFNEIFKCFPLVVRLKDFEEDEQQKIFEN